MTTITIRDLEGEKTYEIAAVLSATRRIISVDGLLCFAEHDPDDGWQLAQEPPSEADRAVLKSLLALDVTKVTVTPPEPPAAD